MFTFWVSSDIVESLVLTTWAATSGACRILDILPCLHFQATKQSDCVVRTIRFDSRGLEELCRDTSVTFTVRMVRKCCRLSFAHLSFVWHNGRSWPMNFEAHDVVRVVARSKHLNGGSRSL